MGRFGRRVVAIASSVDVPPLNLRKTKIDLELTRGALNG